MSHCETRGGYPSSLLTNLWRTQRTQEDHSSSRCGPHARREISPPTTGKIHMHRRLNVTDGHVGFRRLATLDESPETAHEIRLAIARTKAGDRDALRFLYVRYSDN